MSETVCFLHGLWEIIARGTDLAKYMYNTHLHINLQEMWYEIHHEDVASFPMRLGYTYCSTIYAQIIS